MIARHIARLAELFAVSTGIAAPSRAEEKPVLAVMEIECRAKTFSAEMVDNATDYLRASLASSQLYFVVDKGRQEQRRKALVTSMKRESHDPCYDEQCKVELGRNLAADTLLTCRITALGKTCAFGCEMVPLDKAVTETGGLARFDCSEDGLATSIDMVVKQMRGPNEADAGKGDGKGVGKRLDAVVPPDDTRLPRARPRTLGDQYLYAGFPPGDMGDFLDADMSIQAWARYRSQHISGWNCAWCWTIPGACMYFVAANGGNAWHFVRGILYTGGFFGSIVWMASSALDGDGSSLGLSVTMMYASLFANGIDGGVSIFKHNEELKEKVRRRYPLHETSARHGIGPVF